MEILGGGDILLKHPITTRSIVLSVDATSGDCPWSSLAEIYPITPDPGFSWDVDQFAARMHMYEGFPVRYTSDGTIPTANSQRYHGEAISNVAYAAELTEPVLLGNLALRTGSTIRWGPEKMKPVGYVV